MGRDGFEPSKQVAADLHASMTHQLFLFSIVLNSYYFFKLKKTAYDRLPFRRRYFYYGV